MQSDRITSYNVCHTNLLRGLPPPPPPGPPASVRLPWPTTASSGRITSYNVCYTKLLRYLAEFADCYGRCDTRSYLGVYVRGQMSNLERKSVEPMALEAGVPPRSLQAYLSLLTWAEDRMVDRLHAIVVRDHSDPHAIGSVDETGIPKKGDQTAGVQHQWCGRTGKIDNCVVSVSYNFV